MEKTLGELRVRLDFNNSSSSLVDKIKMKSAELIDLCEELRKEEVLSGVVNPPRLVPASGEKHRLISLAQTAYEEAAMWAVKAVTL